MRGLFRRTEMNWFFYNSEHQEAENFIELFYIGRCLPLKPNQS